MLSDPFYVAFPTISERDTIGMQQGGSAVDVADAITLRLADLNPGGSVRIANDGTTSYRLSVSHSKSKENAPYATDRSVVRLDASRADGDGKIVTVSTYIVTANPIGGPHDADMARRLQFALVTLIGYGQSDANGVFSSVDHQLSDRVLAGEP